jgi:hypothetical protein
MTIGGMTLIIVGVGVGYTTWERLGGWALLPTALIIAIGGFVIIVSEALFHSGMNTLESVNVPPGTAEKLPANAILVRSSKEPVIAQSKTLLRPAQGQETPKEELLWICQREQP